jgi:3-hydroxyacyl-[acyl-carrier-protein] dehydratase
MTKEQILAAIPHRPPMLLIDRIVEQSADRVVCQKTFSADEFFVQGHYPDFPIVPGVILCECAMQAGAVLVGAISRERAAESKEQDEPSMPVVAKIKEARFKQMVRPGDTIEIEVNLTDVVSRAYFMSAKVTTSGSLAVRFDFTCMMAHASPNAG